MRTGLHILFVLMSYHSIGQTWEVNISGIVTNWEQDTLSEIPVILFVNADTLMTTLTDENGEFYMDVAFSRENNYAVRLDVERQNTKSYNVDLFTQGDTVFISKYHVDLMVLKVMRERFDNSAYYALNETQNMQNFDIAWFGALLDEYETMCLEFVQTIHPNEKPETARERMKQFKKILRKAGVNMDQLQFKATIHYLTEEQITKNSRSRIQGAITSMDGNCQ